MGKVSSMDITIYWKPKHNRPGRVEKHRIAEGDYDKNSGLIVEFQVDPDRHCWFLGVSKIGQNEWVILNKNNPSDDYYNMSIEDPERKLLLYKAGTQAAYFDWLADNINIILIDGREFWISPELTEE